MVLMNSLQVMPTFLGLLSLLSVNTLASLVDNGTVVNLNGIDYYAGGSTVGWLEVSSGYGISPLATAGSDLIPMTVLRTDANNFSIAELNTTVTRFVKEDDVFQPGFLQAVVLAFNGSGSFHPSVNSCANELPGMNETTFFTAETNIKGAIAAKLSKSLANGPYFVSARTGAVHRAYRLYPDDFLAFVEGIVSDDDGNHFPLPAVTENVMAKSIAVPSRLYYTFTPDQPLAGLRVGVKDIYHMKGIKTSGGNRAYYYQYGTQNATGPAVQRLIDQGAVVVGKTGTVQFANGDRVTADWVDVHCPFNPRGDGYQDPSGSSSGSGAAIGAYDWLDLAIGSDTGGSVRGPAGAQGVYGNRPSTGAISMDHVIPLSPHLDTAGMLARSPSLWSTAVHAWYANFTDDFPSYPRRIYYSSEESGIGADGDPKNAATAIIETFLQGLQTFLGANRTDANLTRQWIDTHPPTAPANLSEFLYAPYGVLTSIDQFNLLGKPLYDDYGAEHDGRRPFINPGPLSRWQWGQNHTDLYDAAVANMTTFQNWYSTYGYGVRNNQTCSEGIFVYPFNMGLPTYRNTYYDAPTQPPLGFAEWAVAGYAAAAELVVPVGEVEYFSTVSLKTEWLPVSVGLQVAHGCDLVVANLVRDLESAGVIKASAVGTRI